MITIITSSISKGEQTNKRNFLVRLWNALNHIDNTPLYIAKGTLMLQGTPDVCTGSVIRFSPGIKFVVKEWHRRQATTIVEVVSEISIYEFEIEEVGRHKYATLVEDSLHIQS